MKSFFGGTYVGKDTLANNNIYYPIRLEYYKTENIENYKSFYGIEVVKTEYKEDKVNVENKVIDKITDEENTINKILEQFKLGEITPAVSEEMIEELLSKK
ncbi:MAG: hypothetical protein HFJ58_00355 [Clostridia bacterium]|nr:hypothetical protein [Clostridia bacterium]